MFKVRPFESRTLSWWNAERDNIDLNPPYQRSSRLWNLPDKTLLVDSIINEFDIPKIYIADFSYVNSELNQSRKQFAVIDGKQRFETIFEFFDGKFTLDSKFHYYQDTSVSIGGLSYIDLVNRYPKIARVFENFNVSVMSVITDDESKINDLFIRLNRSKPLAGAELRNAMKGEVPEIIRSLTEHRFFKTRIRFGTKRAQDKNAAGKLLLTEFLGAFGETKKRQLDQLVEDGILAESASLKRSAGRVEKNLDRMMRIFVENDELLKSQGPLVLYYWLARNVESSELGMVREFLVRFNEARHEAQQNGAKEEGRADEELARYDLMLRSINNMASQVYCYGVLERRFRDFVSEKRA